LVTSDAFFTTIIFTSKILLKDMDIRDAFYHLKYPTSILPRVLEA